MTIRAKILGGFLIIFFIGLALGITGLVSTNVIEALSDEQMLLQKTDASVSTVLNAHYDWRQALTESVLNMGDFTGSLDPASCALGKWKNSDEARQISDATILALLAKIDEPHNYIHTEAKRLVELIEAGDFEGAKTVLAMDIMPRTMETITILSDMSARYAEMLDETSTKLANTASLVVTLIAILLVAALLLSILLSFIIIRNIMTPIRHMAIAAHTIATGDLDVQVSYAVNDEIGKLAIAFQEIIDNIKAQAFIAEKLADGDLTVTVTPKGDKDVMSAAQIRMLDKLNDMFTEIRASTAQVSTGSKQIADGAQSLAQGATEQASVVEELSNSISSIAGKTKINADMAAHAASLAETIRQNAEKGSTQMDMMMDAVRDINAASHSINKVIKVIDDIAFQTNLLALNAAVEAARAGQHGAGFAVVAEEVRNLAAKSAEAAKDTGTLIENSIGKAELGTRIAGETAASLAEIVSGINESSQIVGEIAQSSEDQAAGILQLNDGIGQVSQVVQQNSAAAQESAAASQEMSGQSDVLEQLIGQFKIKENRDGGLNLPSSTRGGGNGYGIPESTQSGGSFGKY